MTVRTRTILAMALVGTVAGLSLPAVAATGDQTTRHVIVVLKPGTTSTAPGTTAALGLLQPRLATVQSATAKAESLGLTVTPSADGATLDVSGPAALIDDTFGSTSPAGTLDAAALGSSVTAVLDPTDTTKVFHPLTATGFTGGQIAAAYGGTQPTTGVAPPNVATRPIVATIQLSSWDPSSLTEYAKDDGVYSDPSFDPVSSGLYSNRPVTQRASGATANCQSSQLLDNSGEQEVVLDQEAILGVAPTLRQRTYTAGNSGSCIFSAYQSVLDDVKAGQPIIALSTSWGSCEKTITTRNNNPWSDASFINAIEGVLSQLTAAGVTVTAATGDDGKYDCVTGAGDPDTSTIAADYPASSAYVLAVGGTHHETGQADTAWNCGDTSYTTCGYGGTGGGYSGAGNNGTGTFTGFNKPSWQVTTGGTQSSKRQTPDVAIDGDPQTGIIAHLSGRVCTDSRADGGLGAPSSPCTGTFGGTSLSSPVMAASIAQLVADHGVGTTITRGKGLVQPTLYAHPEAFTDVVTTQATGSGVITFGTQVGYDESTGLGVPSFASLSAVLFAPAPTLIAPATSTSTTIPIAVSAPAGQSVAAWYVAGVDQGCTGTGTSTPPSTLTLPDGIYTVSARFLTADGRCSDAGTAHVVIDGSRPTLTISSWKRTDASSSRLTAKFVPKDAVGVVAVTYVIKATSSNKTVAQGVMGPAARSLTFKGKPGTRYEIRLTPYDSIGAGKVHTSAATLPVDDRSGSRSGAWKRVPMKGTYLGTVTTSSAPGATESAKVSGATVGVIVTKTPDGGKAQLLVDGRVKKTIDLSARRRTVNQTVTLKVRSGKHTVALRVLGVQGSQRKGTTVTLDGFIGT